MSRWLASILSLPLMAMPAFGSGRKWTDAENMGFAGPVQTATTTRQTFMPEPIQPHGPSIASPAFCEYCEFDRSGNEVGGRTGNDRQRGRP